MTRSFRLISLRGLILCLAALGLAVGAVVLTTTSRAEADASGCTAAPGYTGAANCIAIYGSGLTVDSSKSTYTPGFSPWPESNCNWTSRWKYKPNASSSYHYRTRTQSGCQWIPLIDAYHWWYNAGVMKDGSSFCGKTKSLRTGYAYSSYACKTIHS